MLGITRAAAKHDFYRRQMLWHRTALIVPDYGGTSACRVRVHDPEQKSNASDKAFSVSRQPGKSQVADREIDDVMTAPRSRPG